MEDKNVLNDKETQQVNGGTDVRDVPNSSRNVTEQIVITTEDDSEMIQGRVWGKKGD